MLYQYLTELVWRSCQRRQTAKTLFLIAFRAICQYIAFTGKRPAETDNSYCTGHFTDRGAGCRHSWNSAAGAGAIGSAASLGGIEAGSCRSRKGSVQDFPEQMERSGQEQHFTNCCRCAYEYARSACRNAHNV